jgi:hypothetical protein
MATTKLKEQFIETGNMIAQALQSLLERIIFIQISPFASCT